jgi:drug/metabolite transporter (DMT)-like permease
MVFYFLGIQRIGIARSAPLKGSGPIFSVIFAFGLLGERLILFQYLGIAMVVGGILIISTEGRRRNVPQTSAPPSGPPSDKDRPNAAPARRAVYLLPVLAGLMGGIASILFKTAMKIMPSPLLGVWLGSAEGILLFPLIALLFPAGQRFRFNPAAIPWLVLAGVCGSAAMFGLVLSIGLGQVSVVFTLTQSSPIFVILLSVLFLRKLERVTPRVVLGGLMTVGGGILVSVF